MTQPRRIRFVALDSWRDLSAAFLTAIGHVINLATRNEDAHLHERFAAGALRRMGLQA